MATKSPVVLILGSGPNIGHHVAQSFAAKGYKIALVSRKAKEEDSVAGDSISISSDFSKPESLIDVFAQVKKRLGIPSVVVYNGMHPNLDISSHMLNTDEHLFHSRRRIPKRCCESFSSFSRGFHAGYEHQHHQPLRRSSTSRTRLPTTSRLGI
jgi:NAD(P)-dependent dehydrogenase (short-subunit alcohol dehydrogenase family)